MARGLKDDLPDGTSKVPATDWHDGQITSSFRKPQRLSENPFVKAAGGEMDSGSVFMRAGLKQVESNCSALVIPGRER
jgi:hypothetical protein